MKTVFINGEFVPESEANVSIFDRGFLYGDGLFETLRIYHGKPFRWQQHWDRLVTGAKALKINLPLGVDEARSATSHLISQNKSSEALLRINVSRGCGLRGYSIKGAESPTISITLHEAPSLFEKPISWRLKTSSLRLLKSDPLANIKSANKLTQIVAKTEAEAAGFDDALLLNSTCEIAETTSANFFWIQGEKIFTAPVQAGILPGITRATVIDLCRAQDIPIEEKCVGMETLQNTDGAFLTLSSLEIVEVEAIDERRLNSSGTTKKILQSYRELVTLETSKS